MTKRIDPEIKALRALDRAVATIPPGAEQRSLEWLVAREAGVGAIKLPELRRKPTNSSEVLRSDTEEPL